MPFIIPPTLPKLLNSASPWASSHSDLDNLYACPNTGAITTRTATLNGFQEDPSIHQVAFTKDNLSSLNSYGYSPYPLQYYLDWIENAPLDLKPVILSITASEPNELSAMLDRIQNTRRALSSNKLRLLAVELNTSCPNIQGKPPRSYDLRRDGSLASLLDAMKVAHTADKDLTIGLKLPPYVTSLQFDELVQLLETLTDSSTGSNPISFLTSTNTLGSSLLFDSQVHEFEGSFDYGTDKPRLPIPLGGLAGDSLHPLALGNVYSISSRLAKHRDPSLRTIKIIGVGGVNSAQAARRMYAAGAYAVASATALGTQGVVVFAQLRIS